MELFVKICLKIKKDIFESLLTLFVKKEVVYHFPRRTIRYKLNTDRMRDIYLTMMQVATRFERRQNNAKNDNVVLYKVHMYNVY